MYITYFVLNYMGERVTVEIRRPVDAALRSAC